MKLHRVLLFTEGIWPYVMGGMEKHTYFLCKYLARNQVDVIFVHSNRSGLDAALLEKFSEEEKKYLTAVLIEPEKPRRFPGHYLYETYQYSKRAYEAVKNLIPSCDFVIAIGLGGWYYLNQVKKTVPVATHFHGYDFLQKQFLFRLRLQSIMLRYPFMSQHKHADVIFSLGGKISAMLTKNGVPASKILTIPNAIETEWMRDSPLIRFPLRRFVFVGRYNKTKGIDLFDAAIRTLMLKYSIEIHFVGPIPESAQSKHPAIIYHGTIAQEQKLRILLQSCDILVSPSYSEGMPTVILEAMAAGCAIIATDVGAVSEIVDKQVGWLIPSGDARALSMAMEEAISADDAVLSELKQAAMSRVRAYTWPEVIRKTIRELENRI